MVPKLQEPRATAPLKVLMEHVRGQRASKRKHLPQFVARKCHTSPLRRGLPRAAWVPTFRIITGEMSLVPTLAFLADRCPCAQTRESLSDENPGSVSCLLG